MKTLNQAELFPLHLRVDNHTGQVFVYFDEELNKKEKSRLDEIINEVFKRWRE
jgi:F0F1-type ATP synthase delta subunit